MAIKGYVVCDLDGTLARRLRPVSLDMVRRLVAVLDANWHVSVLTGQPLGDLRKRVLLPMHHDLVSSWARAERLVLYTCEGANRWSLTREGKVNLDSVWCVPCSVTRRERTAVSRLLNLELRRIVSDHHGRIVRGPKWEEDALCSFKVIGNERTRCQVARVVGTVLQASGLGDLRVRTAGLSTVAISRETATKRVALQRIMSGCERGRPVHYLGDEFGRVGNDASTRHVAGVHRVSFGVVPRRISGVQLSSCGVGPSGVARWLRRLLEPDEERKR
jgi:hypothetical protein